MVRARPSTSAKWLQPKIYLEGSLSSGGSGFEKVEDSDDNSSRQSSVSSISQPIEMVPNLREKECQTLEEEFVVTRPSPSLPQPLSQPLLPPTSSAVKPSQVNPPLPMRVSSQEKEEESCSETDSDTDTDEDNGDEKEEVPSSHHSHPSPVIHSLSNQEQPPQRPYFYEDKWFHPKLHTHSPVSSVASLTPSDQEKENQWIPSSTSCSSLPLREKKQPTQQLSRPRPGPDPPLSSPQDVIHVDAPHTHLVLTPYEINVQRKYSDYQPSSSPHVPSASLAQRPFAPISSYQPSPLPLPQSSAPSPREKKSDFISARVSTKSEQGYLPPRDTLDLSNLSFEVCSPSSFLLSLSQPVRLSVSLLLCRWSSIFISQHIPIEGNNLHLPAVPSADRGCLCSRLPLD
jgi:hypothetical protein